jgi:hypothetical protein
LTNKCPSLQGDGLAFHPDFELISREASQSMPSLYDVMAENNILYVYSELATRDLFNIRDVSKELKLKKLKMFAKGSTNFKAGCDVKSIQSALRDNLKKISNKIYDQADSVSSSLTGLGVLWGFTPFMLVFFSILLKYFGPVVVIVIHFIVIFSLRVKISTLISILD